MNGADLGESLPGNGKNICKSSEQEKCGKFKNLETSSVALRRRRIMVRGEVTRRKTGFRTCFPLRSFQLLGGVRTRHE